MNHLINTLGFTEIYLSVVLVFAGIIDYKKQKIPNYLTFPTVLIALIYHFYLSGLNGLLFSILGMFTGIALLIIPYIMGGMGAGDVKLLGAIGSFVGYKSVVFVFLFTALFGGLYAIVVLIWYEKSLMIFLKITARFATHDPTMCWRNLNLMPIVFEVTLRTPVLV